MLLIDSFIRFFESCCLNECVVSHACRYHSHPRMIAIPSHVDVRTQRDYQAMDPGFVGLIVSLFNQSNAAVCAQQDVCWDLYIRI